MPRPDSPADPAALAPRVVRGSYLLQVLFFDRTFRWVLMLALLAALAVGLLVPRLWRVTPPGWAPPVRISALDWFAARSLRRSARAAQAAGQLPTAVAGWRLVLGRLPTDPEALRALVDLLPAAHRAQPDAGLGPLLDGVGAWLLRLTGTNVADLTAVAASQAERRNWPWIAAQTAAAPAPLPGPLQSLRLAALFELGRLPEFEAAWTHPAAALADDRRAQLYHAAWVALTGRPAGQGARERLAAAATDPAWGPTALRLLLPVAQRDLAATAYERHLTALRALGQDGLPEHVNFWSLLWATGQRERAAALADSFGGLPESADEAGPYLDTLLLLRRPALVRAFVRRGLPRLADQPTVWISAAEALLRLEDWEELRALAADLRQQLPLRPLLGNLPDFYDGAAEHGLGHPARAEAAFAALLEKPPARPEFALPPAVHLNRLG